MGHSEIMAQDLVKAQNMLLLSMQDFMHDNKMANKYHGTHVSSSGAVTQCRHTVQYINIYINSYRWQVFYFKYLIG